MKILKVGIASYADMKARTMAIARGELKPGPGDPKVWFPSTESLVRVLSEKNRLLLGTIQSGSAHGWRVACPADGLLAPWSIPFTTLGSCGCASRLEKRTRLRHSTRCCRRITQIFPGHILTLSKRIRSDGTTLNFTIG